MSRTLVVMIALVAVLPVAVILRWQRDVIIRWICPSEMLFLDTAEARYRVHGRGLNAFLRHRRTWIAFIAYAVGLTVLSLGLAELTIAVSRVGQWSGTGVKLAAILCAVIPLHLIPLMYVRYREWMRVFLRQYLNDQGIPVCRGCGYDLRGQTNARCPECGWEFRLREPGIEGAHPVNGGG